MNENLSTAEMLSWQLDAGVDECIGDVSLDHFAVVPEPVQPALAAKPDVVALATPIATPTLPPPAAADSLLHEACALAGEANNLDELRQALQEFDGCGLKKTATNLVFGDGAEDARIVFVGEAPGAEEDRQGLPFVGLSGQLLDKMLASIGLDRAQVYITNTVFWRPPGNRTPTTTEAAVCQPFVERLMELIDPELVVALGGPAAKALLAESSGIGRLRGRWFEYSTPRLSRPAQATALYHPSYLLSSPAHKRDTWADLLAIRDKLVKPL